MRAPRGRGCGSIAEKVRVGRNSKEPGPMQVFGKSEEPCHDATET
jgi:hypothetical protein